MMVLAGMTWRLAARCTRCVGVRGIHEGWQLYWFISRDLYGLLGLTQLDGGIEAYKLFYFYFIFLIYLWSKIRRVLNI
jgi:hypothetical protein